MIKMNKFNGITFLKKSLPALLLPALLTGCATHKKPDVVHERAWMGGQLEIVRTFPKQLTPRPKAGILVKALATNTPAFSAGLREGDVILSVDQTPIHKLREFRNKIEATSPGDALTMSVYRDGTNADYHLILGTEKYRKSGMLSIFLPIYSAGYNFWPTENYPGISLIALGYELDGGGRPELYSVRNEYLKKADPHYQPYEKDFECWLALLRVSTGKNIISQTPALAQK